MVTEPSNLGDQEDRLARARARIDWAIEAAQRAPVNSDVQAVTLWLDDVVALKQLWSPAFRLNRDDLVQVEAVARALCYYHGYASDQMQDGTLTWHAYIGQARVVIDSLAKVAES